MDPEQINPNEDIHPDPNQPQTWNELFPGSGILVGGGAPSGGTGLQPNAGGLSPIAQDLKSSNFNAGSTGWRIRSNGDVEFNSGTFRSQLIAGSIDIPNTTTANSFHVDVNGNAWWGATTLASGVAWVKKDGSAKFTSGTIGGWTIGATTIYSTNIIIDNANDKITVGSGANQILLDGASGGISSQGSTWVMNGDGTVTGMTPRGTSGTTEQHSDATEVSAVSTVSKSFFLTIPAYVAISADVKVSINDGTDVCSLVFQPDFYVGVLTDTVNIGVLHYNLGWDLTNAYVNNSVSLALPPGKYKLNIHNNNSRTVYLQNLLVKFTKTNIVDADFVVGSLT